MSTIETAVLALLGQPGAGTFTASQLSRELGHPRAEVDAALASLGAAGEVVRRVEWGARRLLTLWRYAGGSR